MSTVETARARITDTLAKAEAAHEWGWYEDRDGDLMAMASGDAVFVIAVSPDLMIRVCREALALMGRHVDNSYGGCVRCYDWAHDGERDIPFPCPAVNAVVRAWTS